MSNFLAEALGTMILIILGCGVNAGGALTKTFSNAGGWLMGAIGWGLGVMFAIFAVGNISGAHLNPAVTVGLAVAGKFDWAQAPTYIAGQMLGAFIGATIVFLQYLPHWKETQDPATKLGVFSTSPAVQHTVANLISEIIGTAVLVLGLLFIGANSFADGVNPLIIGLLITSIGISLGGSTGYAINPARDLGPRIAHAILPIAGKGDSNWSYAWIPVVGPIVGGALGAVVYNLLW
jgi:glycerol uptake facilitator protein